MDKDYTKRELDEHFKVIGDKLDANTKLTEELNTKVGIQNGRVGKLESKWTGVVMGGSVSIFLIGILMSLLVYSFRLSLVNLKNEVLLEINQ